MPALEIKGAVLDGQVFEGAKGVKELSKYPTREEALGQTVTLILGPARKLAAQIKGPGSNIAGIIKAIETKLGEGRNDRQDGLKRFGSPDVVRQTGIQTHRHSTGPNTGASGWLKERNRSATS